MARPAGHAKAGPEPPEPHRINHLDTRPMATGLLS